MNAQDSADVHAHAFAAAQGSCNVHAHDLLFAARIAHEVNRAYCQALGDQSQPPWSDAPAWQRKSLIDGARYIVENPKSTPADQHANWLRHKFADGWTWGPVKDVIAKKHPCMKDYEELPQAQRIKDALFRAVIKATLSL